MTFPFGETVECNTTRTSSGTIATSILRRRPPSERHHRLPQFRCAADVAAFVKGHVDFKPLLTHWVSSRIVPRTEAVHRCL